MTSEFSYSDHLERIAKALESIAGSLVIVAHPPQIVSSQVPYVPPVPEPRFVEPPIPMHAATDPWGGNAT